MTPMPLLAGRHTLQAIIDHARRDAPNECCGLLLGTGERVEAVYPARNECESPTEFQIDPEDHFAALHEARERGLEVIGFYHSHPASAAVPSSRDLADASYPDAYYVIASVADDEVKAYRLSNGNFRPIPIVRAL